MLEHYIDVIEASKIPDVPPETVKRLIREDKLTATKFGNKWIIERDRLRVSANMYGTPAGLKASSGMLSYLLQHK